MGDVWTKLIVAFAYKFSISLKIASIVKLDGIGVTEPVYAFDVSFEFP